MNTVKRLAMAAGAWLQYEFACDRSQLFDEGSLVTPVSAALDTIYKQKLHTEFLHPVLASIMSGPDRRLELDFAVIGTYPQIACAVETKWVGADGIRVEDVSEICSGSSSSPTRQRRMPFSCWLGEKASQGLFRFHGLSRKEAEAD
jgi:hypothetical protein